MAGVRPKLARGQAKRKRQVDSRGRQKAGENPEAAALGARVGRASSFLAGVAVVGGSGHGGRLP